MVKKVYILVLLCLVAVLVACQSNEKAFSDMTEAKLDLLMPKVFDYIQNDNQFDIQGGHVSTDKLTGYPTMYLSVNEEAGVDYEAYKSIIWDALGYKFNIEFELIAFPDEPMIQGVIMAFDYNNRYNQKSYIGEILVVELESDFETADGIPYYDALEITIIEGNEIVSKEGNVLTYDDLELGMTVSSYERGMVLETYPGMTGTEKLIVDINSKAHMVEEKVGELEFQNKFKGVNYYGPYPYVYSNYYYDIPLDEWDESIVFYFDFAYVYYDKKDNFDLPSLYEGKFLWNHRSNLDQNRQGIIEDVVILADQDIESWFQDDLYYFKVPVYRNDELIHIQYVLNQQGDMSEIIFE